jgi:hypothetical protein
MIERDVCSYGSFGMFMMKEFSIKLFFGSLRESRRNRASFELTLMMRGCGIYDSFCRKVRFLSLSWSSLTSDY